MRIFKRGPALRDLLVEELRKYVEAGGCRYDRDGRNTDQGALLRGTADSDVGPLQIPMTLDQAKAALARLEAM